jgi:hypothetical protein
MSDDELRDLEAARDEALLAANAISSPIEHVGDLTGGRRNASIAIFRDDALRHLENALAKLKSVGDEEGSKK